MKYLNTYKEGDNVSGVYYCKDKKTLESKAGKPYYSLIVQDKTKGIDGKVWDVNAPEIDEFVVGDFIEIVGEMISFNGSQQIRISRIRKVDSCEIDITEFVPTTTSDIEKMWEELLGLKDSVKNAPLKKLLDLFLSSEEVINGFKTHSAAKKLHHAFVGGLLEHTLAVTKLCEHFANEYVQLNRDLLITGAILHDIGKIREISSFPDNDYTDKGQLLGHIVIGAQMIHDAVKTIPEFNASLETELNHMILSHHGEYEFGSPKKPSIVEALVLNMADNADAKIQMFKEFADGANKKNAPWLGYSKVFESNLRLTTEE